MYDVVFSNRAQSDVRRLDRATAQRVIGKLRWLAENFEATKLTALTGPEQGQFRLRVGDWIGTTKRPATRLCFPNRYRMG